MSKKKVFLGGTCNGSDWRSYAEFKLKSCGVDFFNPIVKDWNEKAQAIEILEKEHRCNIHLYVITPLMLGCFSIAEAVESAHRKDVKTIFCFISFDKNTLFDSAQLRSLDAVGKLIERHGGIYVPHSLMKAISQCISL